MALERTLFEIRVKECKENREYWLSRPWLSTRRDSVLGADVLVVPWENFRENQAALYPKGSTEVISELARQGPLSIALAVDDEQYVEILLHSKMQRLPALLVTHVALPALAGMLGNLMYDSIAEDDEVEQVQIKLIVQGENGQCVSLDYSGPPGRLAETLIEEASRCFPNQAPSQPKKNKIQN